MSGGDYLYIPPDPEHTCTPPRITMNRDGTATEEPAARTGSLWRCAYCGTVWAAGHDPSVRILGEPARCWRRATRREQARAVWQDLRNTLLW
jgi:hypothetical protein